MKLTDLALTAAERKGSSGLCSPSEKSSTDKGPKYNYGTRITLQKEDLSKLGLKLGSFSVGDTVLIEAKATIKSLNMSEGDSYDSSRVELQITDLAITSEDGDALKAVSKAIDDADEDDAN